MQIYIFSNQSISQDFCSIWGYRISIQLAQTLSIIIYCLLGPIQSDEDFQSAFLNGLSTTQAYICSVNDIIIQIALRRIIIGKKVSDKALKDPKTINKTRGPAYT